jgi:hypothetical protein
VRLYVGPCGAKEFADTVDGQLLYLVHHFATAVIAPPGVAFGVFIRQAGAHGIQYRLAGEVFGSNQLQAAPLAVEFLVYKGEYDVLHEVFIFNLNGRRPVEI